MALFFIDKKINVLILISNYKLLKLSIMNTIFIFLIVAILAIFIIAQVILKKLQSKNFSEAESNSDIERMVNAYRSGAQYKRARTRLWELMIIGPAIIALLGFGGYYVALNYQKFETSYPHFLKAPAEVYHQEYERVKQERIEAAESDYNEFKMEYERVKNNHPEYSFERAEKRLQELAEEVQKAKSYEFSDYEKRQSKERNALRIMLIVSIVLWYLFALISESKWCKDCNSCFISTFAIILAGDLLILMFFVGCTQAEWLSVLIIYAICYFLYRLNVKKSKI